MAVEWIGDEPPPAQEWEGEEPPAAPILQVQLNGERPRLTVIGDVVSRKIEWLEPELIAKGLLTGLLAPGGTGKGLYGIHLSTKLALRGERTLFLCSEDALDYIVRPRFEAAGCDAQLAHALDVQTAEGSRELRFPSDLPLLSSALDALEPALVIIDPMLSYIDPGLDLAKNNQMRAILQPLIGLARDTGTAIVPVYHLGKDRARGAIGSVAFEDACRQVLTVARDDEDEDLRHLELTKSNVGRTGYGRQLRIVEVPVEIDGESVPMAKLVDEGRSGKSVFDLLTVKDRPGPDPTQRQEAKAQLVSLLVEARGDSISAGAAQKRVATEAGVSTKTVFRAFGELKDEGLVGATPARDEYGTITEWRWFAKTELLVHAHA